MQSSNSLNLQAESWSVKDGRMIVYEWNDQDLLKMFIPNQNLTLCIPRRDLETPFQWIYDHMVRTTTKVLTYRILSRHAMCECPGHRFRRVLITCRFRSWFGIVQFEPIWNRRCHPPKNRDDDINYPFWRNPTWCKSYFCAISPEQVVPCLIANIRWLIHPDAVVIPPKKSRNDYPIFWGSPLRQTYGCTPNQCLVWVGVIQWSLKISMEPKSHPTEFGNVIFHPPPFFGFWALNFPEWFQHVEGRRDPYDHGETKGIFQCHPPPKK